jgi:UDP-N-acetylmuramoyl-L-alanyl-D-glutamate--2,6-diaminopimelate ligase
VARARGRAALKPFPPAPAWVSELEHVGITGTNGKTSTTRLVAAALGSLTKPVASFTTVGSFLDEEPIATAKSYRGVLDTIFAAKQRGGRYAVLEVTSEVLALGFARRWPFRVGVFTNLSHDHLDAHGTPEHYFASKAQLFHALPPERGIAVVNGCDEVADLLFEATPAGVRKLAYGIASRGEAQVPLDARVVAVAVSLTGTHLTLELGPALGGGSCELTTRAIGEIFAENAVAAFVTALALGAQSDAAARAIAAATPPAGRFQVVAEEPCVVIDYAHTPDALRRTLLTARQLARGRVILVFGASGNRDKAKRPVMGEAAASADRVILTSDNARDEDPHVIAAAVRAGMPHALDVVLELDREQAIQCAVLDAESQDVIVIAGKGHETTQLIAGVSREFSDAEVARRALAERGVR